MNVDTVAVGRVVSVGKVGVVGSVGNVGNEGSEDDGVSEGAFGPNVTPASGSFGSAWSPPPCRASPQLVAAMAATATMDAAMVSGIRPGSLLSRPASSALAGSLRGSVGESLAGSVAESFAGSFGESGSGFFSSGGPHPSLMRPIVSRPPPGLQTSQKELRVGVTRHGGRGG